MSSRNVRAALLLLLLAVGLGVLAWLLGRGTGTGSGPDEREAAEPFTPFEAPEPAAIGSVTGRLVVYGTDRPAEDVPVRIEGGDGKIEVATDAGGSFLALVPSDRTLTVVVEPPETFASIRLPGIRVSRGSSEALGTLCLSPPFEVRGEVTGPDGSGVPGAVVRVYRPRPADVAPTIFEILGDLGTPRPPIAETTADDEGRFTIGDLHAGLFRFEAHAGDLVAGALPEVTVTPDEDVEPLSIALHRGSTLAGTVRGEDGEPLAGVSLTALYGGRDPLASRDFCPVRAESDAAGRFELPPLDSTIVDVVASLPGYPVRVLENVSVETRPALEIVLGGTATLEGRVAGPGGEAVVDASILTIVRGDGGTVARARTDEEGRYRLERLPAGRIRFLLVDSPRYAPWPPPTLNPMDLQNGFGELAPGQTLAKNIELDRGTTVTGAVVDAARGHPVPSARVRAISPQTVAGWSGGRSTIADENGRYVLVGVAEGPHALLADAEGYYQPGTGEEMLQAMFRLARAPAEPPAEAPLLLLRPNLSRKQKNLALLPAATISGTVLDPEGNPVASARVEAFLESDESGQMLTGVVRTGAGPVLTDSEGRFRLTGARALGRLLLVASAEDAVDGVSAPVAPTPGQELEGVEIRLHAPARIAGRILDADGRPLAGAKVRAARVEEVPGRPAAPAPGVWTPSPDESGPDGGFAIGELAPGKYALTIRGPGHLVSRPEAIVVAEGERADAGAIRLERGYSIEGRVANPADEPIPGARVEIVPGRDVDGSLFFASPVTTDARGRYSIDSLPPGSYGLTVSAPGYAPERADTKAGERDVSFRLEEGKTIEGRILLPDGSPAEGIHVTAYGEDGGTARAVSGPAGQFRFTELHSGDFRIEAMPDPEAGPSGMTTGPDVRTTTMTGVPAGARDVEIRLKPGLEITGVVVTAEGSPVSGATVIASGAGPESFAATDEGGRFRFRRLAPGDYRLAANQPREGLTGEADGVAAGSNGVRIVVAPR